LPEEELDQRALGPKLELLPLSSWVRSQASLPPPKRGRSLRAFLQIFEGQLLPPPSWSTQDLSKNHSKQVWM
jgi:hypothetical protein